ncbi:patatin-like phospholipase family protein [Brevundimonas goettingensis]|uniref:Patatin-like phospholipase family protein n=1 Tax=Brevundimonas goettingensis TaxID=2774190 RepID=A0A975GWM6_9CAUL|nr:patatin-like phospholipase family protein [Brevundimonas goettingensis]QTC89650.1 patatin-like phospholipase family protein [Brevundimonas goettingensis]
MAAAASPKDGAFDLLALSGGGAEGAYGAGLLTGWGERGDRPVFEVVTGVSTGALMAPFVFIGSEGDAELRAAFTDGRSSRVLSPRWLMALRGPGVFRQKPLRDLVASAVTPEVIAGVAQGHREGRRLYVATTSLDTQDQVIWDVGALAASDRPDARERFIDILVASSSIPGVFPPVFIDLERDGRRVRELHADGRTTANFFVAPEGLMMARDLFGPAEAGQSRRLWVILNGRPEPVFSVAPYQPLSVAGRGLDAMMKASTRMNLIASRRFAEANAMGFDLAMAPVGAVETSLDFSPEHMQALFDAGRTQGLSGAAWSAGTLATQ